MSDDYEVVGYILKKKPSGDGCAGCLGALIVIAILGACIESCVGGKTHSGNAHILSLLLSQCKQAHRRCEMVLIVCPGFRSLQCRYVLWNSASVAGIVLGKVLRIFGQLARHAMDIERWSIRRELHKVPCRGLPLDWQGGGLHDHLAPILTICHAQPAMAKGKFHIRRDAANVVATVSCSGDSEDEL